MAKLVRESIDFKRGQTSKRALTVGRFHDNPSLKWFHDEALERGYKEITPDNYPTEPDANEISDLSIYEKGKIQLHLYIHGKPDHDDEYGSFHIKATIDDGDPFVHDAVGEWANSDYWWDHVETLEKEAFNEN